MNSFENLRQIELQNRIKTYGILLNATYYLIRGSELVNCLDISQCPPIVAELTRKIKPFAEQIEPYSKQLAYHLSQDNNHE